MHYLDNSATTKTNEKYIETYGRVCREVFGNPSSLHRLGSAAERELTFARKKLAQALGASEDEIIFTSTGTEANNLAIFGTAKRHGRIIISSTEHPSVYECAEELSKRGFDVVKIPAPLGKLDLEALEAALSPDTLLVSVMMVNNETGAIYPVDRLKPLMKRLSPRALLHIDAVQAFCKIPFSCEALGCDLLSVSSHKIHAGRGAGALYVRKGVNLTPVIYGGGQEKKLRSGTENIAAISAFAQAAADAQRDMEKNLLEANELLKYCLQRLEDIKGVHIHRPSKASPYILCISVPGIKSEIMIHLLEEKDVYISAGSACSAKKAIRSRILEDFGLSESELQSVLRISTCFESTKNDIDALCAGLAAEIKAGAKA